MYLLIWLSIMFPLYSFQWCMAQLLSSLHPNVWMCNRCESRTQSVYSPSHLLLCLPEVASKQIHTALLPNMPMQLSNDFKMPLIPLPGWWEQPYNLVWLSWAPASSQLSQSSQSTESVQPLWLLVLAQRGQTYSLLWFFQPPMDLLLQHPVSSLGILLPSCTHGLS